jgi:hypothetical protein
LGGLEMAMFQYGLLGLLGTVKGARVLLFIVVWNLLCGCAMLLGFLGPAGQAGAFVAIVLAGAFTAYSGFAPIVSTRIRKQWCRQESDFEQARSGLVMLGLMGTAFCVVTIGGFTCRIAGIAVSEVVGMIGMWALVTVIAVLWMVFGNRGKGKRTTKEFMRRGTRTHLS